MGLEKMGKPSFAGSARTKGGDGGRESDGSTPGVVDQLSSGSLIAGAAHQAQVYLPGSEKFLRRKTASLAEQACH